MLSDVQNACKNVKHAAAGVSETQPKAGCNQSRISICLAMISYLYLKTLVEAPGSIATASFLLIGDETHAAPPSAAQRSDIYRCQRKSKSSTHIYESKPDRYFVGLSGASCFRGLCSVGWNIIARLVPNDVRHCWLSGS
eukprot:6201203-Pleurochrysis_carterae.AAC.1